MNNPINAFEEIRDNFLLYVKTAFKTQFESLEREREELLRQSSSEEPGVFYQDPWLEILPRYTTSKRAIDLTPSDVPGMTAAELSDLSSFVTKGLIGDYELFSHQVEMLRLAAAGRNGVVTAGTGSGKTESFLLPLFAYLVAESAGWAQPRARAPHQDDWWHQSSERWRQTQTEDGCSFRVSQRLGENRPSAMRALILYPMNALVEDQLTRLRKALDSPTSREWLANHRNGNRFYFGRYNGVTPVPGLEYTSTGAPNKAKLADLLQEMQTAHTSARAAQAYADRHSEDDAAAEVPYFFPRLDGAEMRSRWDMQDAAPDLLITNTSMLSIMLMRQADAPIFEQTRQWLQQEGSIFHLIVDELHLYRGTAGTEVAYLLRLLLARLGVSPSSPKVRILASSASLDPGDPDSLRFLREFFGCEWSPDQIIAGAPLPIAPLDGPPFLDPSIFAEFASQASFDDEAKRSLTRQLGGGETENPTTALVASLETGPAQLPARLSRACSPKGDGVELRAVSLDTFAGNLFGSVDLGAGRRAVSGLMAARALCASGPKSPLPSFRFHWFFRNIEGLWACTNPDCECQSGDGRTAGRLFGQPRILCASASSQHRVLELLYCEVCGTTMFGGSRLTLEDNLGWELLNTDPDIEGIPDRQAARFLDRRTYADYGVFWPSGAAELHRDATRWSQPQSDDSEDIPAAQRRATWSHATLDVFSARVTLGAAREDQLIVNGGSLVSGYVFRLAKPDRGWPQVGGTPSLHQRIGALPAVCPCCASDYTQRLYRRSPIRGFRTGFGKVSQLLAKELMYQLPVENRKLVVFSDSREDAATIANGIERNHYSDLIREAMYDELLIAAVGGSELLIDLRSHGRPVSELSRAVAERLPGLASMLASDIEILNTPVPENLPEIYASSIRATRDASQKRIEIIEQQAVSRSVPGKVLYEPVDGVPSESLIRRLKSLGVNPAGNDVLYQEFYVNDRWEPWTSFYDFTTTESCWRDDPSPEMQQRIEGTIRPKIAAEISSVLWSRSYFSFESSGLGYPCLNLSAATWESLAARSQIPVATLQDACKACLRILGDLYRFHDPNGYSRGMEDWVSWEAPTRVKLRNWLEQLALVNSASQMSLEEVIWEAICEAGGQRYLVLDPRHLAIRVAVPGDPVWVCRTCRREHLHGAAGVCTRCLSPLPASPTLRCADLHESNYYAREAESRRQPVRLHCEELTAQTDDQPERQRLFRGIVVDTGQPGKRHLTPAVDEIDLLSVTTTMEVGVDIGGLQAVMMANMPPMRFNYQQRVGRAGRRGQAFAAVLTLCRGRSHDEHYYRNPSRITGDKPPVPFLSMDRAEIPQRLMAKECLRRAFLRAGIGPFDGPTPPDSHGEFSTVSAWNDSPPLREQVTNWLRTDPDVASISESLVGDGAGDITAAELEDFAREVLPQDVEACLQNGELIAEGLANRLAEGAVMPMFGMPSRVRLMYHGFRTGDREPLYIDRDLDLAVTEFAPGSQKTKDKRIHTAIGFTAPYIRRHGHIVLADEDPTPWRQWMAHCQGCHWTVTSQDQPTFTFCRNCGLTVDEAPGMPSLEIFPVVVPVAFRTALTRGADAKEDGEVFSGGAGTLTEEGDATPEHVAGTNSICTLIEGGRVYRVNNRRGQGFKGGVGTAALNNGKWEFHHQWIDERFQNTQDGVRFTADYTEPNPIAIIAPKTTDVLRIRPRVVPAGLVLDPSGESMGAGASETRRSSAGVKAAFYSAAFLLRAVAAEALDIDPEELDISNVRRVPGDGGNVGEIVIHDHLPNGAGFSSWIRANWENIIRSIADPAEGSFAESLIRPNHQRCETSCPDCLRHFRNMVYHGLLDWRLGLAATRMLGSDSTLCGLDGAFDLPELIAWPNQANSIRNLFCESFGDCAPREFGRLPGFTLNGRAIIVVHPLWSTQNPQGILAEAIADAGSNWTAVDTFNSMRRLSHVYQSLGVA